MGEIKSAQFQVLRQVLAAFFHPLPYPRIFPSAPPDSFNALKTRFENFFSSQSVVPKAREIRAEILAFYRNEGRKKYSIGIGAEHDRRIFKFLVLLNYCYCYETRASTFSFFFFFPIRIGGARNEAHISRNWPHKPGRDSNDRETSQPFFLWSRLIRNCAISSRQIGSILLISRSFETASRHSTLADGRSKGRGKKARTEEAAVPLL